MSLLSKYFSNVRKIGKGGFGIVHYGEHNGQAYAIKELSYKNEEERKQIENEVIFLRSLKYGSHCNPHIACYYGSLVDSKNKKIYIVMEYIKGTNINSYIKKLSGDEKYNFCLYAIDCISRTLKFIHDGGLLYLDLQPENVLITSDKQIKLIDFGISCAYQQNSLGQVYCLQDAGVSAFRAPETSQYGVNTAATDVWLLGATIYYCLTGIPINSFYKNVYDRTNYVPLQTGLLLLDFIVNKCLELEMQDRITLDEIRSKLEYFNYLN